MMTEPHDLLDRSLKVLTRRAAPAVKAELLGVAVMVGLRFFARHLLEAVFRKEMAMLKEVEFVRGLFADELAEREALGSRRLLLRQLRAKFGELPASVVERIEKADPAEYEEWAVRLLHAGSLEEIGFFESGAPASGHEPR